MAESPAAPHAPPGVPHPRWQADLALALVCLIWGATFVIVKSALDDVSTLLFLGLRFGAATLALAVIFCLTKGWREVLGPGPAIGGILAGCCLFGGYFLQTEGLKYTTPGNSGFITGLYIVLVPLLSAAAYRKAPARSEWAGVALAAAGMSVMMLRRDMLHVNLGDALTVGCAVLFAAHILVLGRVAPDMSTERLTVLQLGTCAVLGLTTYRWMETPVLRLNGTVWIALAVTSLLATALAFTIQTWAQRFTTPTRTALIFSLEPVFALATSYVVGAEELTVRSMLGAGCILAGILVVELKPMK